MVAPIVVSETDLVLTLPSRIARVFAGSHGLRVVEPPAKIPGVSIWQVWHRRRQQDAGHAWLRGIVSDVAGADTKRA